MITTNGTEALAVRLINEVWNQRCSEAVDGLFSRDFSSHDLCPGPVADRQGYKLWVRDVLSDVQQVRVTVDGILSAGDKVAVRYMLRASVDDHERTAMGAVILRFVGGRIREGWGMSHMVSLLHRIRPDASMP